MTSHKILQYFTFNMGKSNTFVDVQVTDEGGRDKEFPECLFYHDIYRLCVTQYAVAT